MRSRCAIMLFDVDVAGGGGGAARPASGAFVYYHKTRNNIGPLRAYVRACVRARTHSHTRTLEVNSGACVILSKLFSHKRSILQTGGGGSSEFMRTCA